MIIFPGIILVALIFFQRITGDVGDGSVCFWTLSAPTPSQCSVHSWCSWHHKYCPTNGHGGRMKKIKTTKTANVESMNFWAISLPSGCCLRIYLSIYLSICLSVCISVKVSLIKQFEPQRCSPFHDGSFKPEKKFPFGFCTGFCFFKHKHFVARVKVVS